MEKELTEKYLESLWKAREEDFVNQNLEQTIDINHMTRVFYSLIELEHYVYNKDYKKFKSTQKRFNKQFAIALHDYLTLACIGELRHIDDCLVSYRVKHQLSSTRTKCFRHGLKYSRESIIQNSLDYFNPHNFSWHSSYGGKSWFTIAKANSKYSSIPDILYIDLVIHVRHNGGRMFDRSMIFFNEDSNFRSFLDWRFSANPEDWKRYYIPYELKDIRYTFDNETKSLFPLDCTSLYLYQPKIFGFRDLSQDIGEIEDREKDYENDYNDDDDEFKNENYFKTHGYVSKLNQTKVICEHGLNCSYKGKKYCVHKKPHIAKTYCKNQDNLCHSHFGCIPIEHINDFSNKIPLVKCQFSEEDICKTIDCTHKNYHTVKGTCINDTCGKINQNVNCKVTVQSKIWFKSHK